MTIFQNLFNVLVARYSRQLMNAHIESRRKR